MKRSADASFCSKIVFICDNSNCRLCSTSISDARAPYLPVTSPLIFLTQDIASSRRPSSKRRKFATESLSVPPGGRWSRSHSWMACRCSGTSHKQCWRSKQSIGSTYLRPSDAALNFSNLAALTTLRSLMSTRSSSRRKLRSWTTISHISSFNSTASAAAEKFPRRSSRWLEKALPSTSTSISQAKGCESLEFVNESIFNIPSSETGLTSLRIRNLSNKAASSSLSGSSFDAPMTQRIEQSSWPPALSNFRSFRIVNSVFNIAEFALNISSRKAIDAVGRYPLVTLRYSSFSKLLNERGPNSSSGVVKRVSNRWKKDPQHKSESLRPRTLFPVPGLTIKKKQKMVRYKMGFEKP